MVVHNSVVVVPDEERGGELSEITFPKWRAVVEVNENGGLAEEIRGFRIWPFRTAKWGFVKMSAN